MSARLPHFQTRTKRAVQSARLLRGAFSKNQTRKRCAFTHFLNAHQTRKSLTHNTQSITSGMEAHYRAWVPG